MKMENEITVEVDTDLETLDKILKEKGFKVKKECDLNDIYMIRKEDKTGDYLTMLSKCILLRHSFNKDFDKKRLSYKYKEYNDNMELIKDGKIEVIVDDIDKAKQLLEVFNFEELLRLYDHMYIYVSDKDEFAVQVVNNKHIYIEIENECNIANRVYQSQAEMKQVLTDNNIPIKGNNYFVRKALIELEENDK